MTLPPDRLKMLVDLLVDIACPELRLPASAQGGLTPKKRQCCLTASLQNLGNALKPILDLAA